MEDTIDPTQPTEPTPVVTPVPTEPTVPVAQAAEVIPPVTPVQPATPVAEATPTEESFLRKNKMLIIGGIVALIVVTVAVGILLSLKNSEKLEGMIKIQKDYIQTQEHSVKIPRTKK